MVGLGGSGTNDAGAGLLAALGAVALDRGLEPDPAALRGGGAGLGRIGAVDLVAARQRLGGVDLVAATDVDNPLLGPGGPPHGFGPQKGATPHQVQVLEDCLAAFAAEVGRRPDGKDPAVALGAGAAGGLGFALLALGARRVPGIATVVEAVDLADRVARADLVVTGEGAFDWQSLRGKVVSGVARRASPPRGPSWCWRAGLDVGRREWRGLTA